MLGDHLTPVPPADSVTVEEQILLMGNPFAAFVRLRSSRQSYFLILFEETSSPTRAGAATFTAGAKVVGTLMRVVQVVPPQPSQSENIVWEWDRKVRQELHREADSFFLKLVKQLNPGMNAAQNTVGFTQDELKEKTKTLTFTCGRSA